MTDKIYPTWVNDRLPTEEDGDASQLNYVLYLNTDNIAHCCNYKNIYLGEDWCKVPDEWSAGWPKNWRNFIALPQECLDREKGEVKRKLIIEKDNDSNAYLYGDMISMYSVKAKKSYINNIEAWVELARIGNDCEKISTIKDLEQALAKSEERVKMFEANKEMLDKHVKEVDDICSQSCDYAEELEKEIKELHKLLIKEWGG